MPTPTLLPRTTVLLWGSVVALGCGPPEPSPPPHAALATPRLASSTAASSPSPVPTLAGKLYGAPFAPKKIFVFRDFDYSKVYFAESPATVPCRFEDSDRPQYIEATSLDPFEIGKTLRGGEGPRFSIVSAIDPREPLVHAELTLLSFGNGRATGSIQWRRSDNNFLEGTFEAIDCPTRAKVRDDSVPANGLRWLDTPPPLTSIPNAPVTGFVAGDAFRPAAGQN